MAYRDVVLTDTPLDFYEMETSTGTDAGSGARTLTLNGGITTGVTGIIGNSWLFDGVNDNASMATFPTLTTAYTLEAWVKTGAGVAASTTTPTIIRKDGTDIVIMRMRGGSASSPGQIELYIAGYSLNSGTGNRIDDGNWHHVVYTQAGSAAKIYIDGTLRNSGTASKSSFNFGTGTNGHIGSDNNGTAEFWDGNLDNVAIYGTALSAARVTAHYNAAYVNYTYTANAMTVTANTPTAVITGQKHVTYSAAPMVLTTASMPNAVVKQVYPTQASVDYGFDQNGNISNADTLYIMGGNTGGSNARITTVLKYTAPPPGSVYDAATLALYQKQGGAGLAIKVYPILAPFSGTPSTKAAFTLGTPITFTALGLNTTKTLSIGSLLTSQVYGFLLEGDDTSSDYAYFWSNEGSVAPAFNVQYHNEIIDVVVPAGPMTVNLTSPDATVSLVTDKTIALDPMTMSLSMPDANIVVDKDVTFVAEAMTAELDFPGGQFTKSIVVAAEPFSVALTSPSSVTGTTTGVIYHASPMTMTGRMVGLSSVNGNPVENDGADDRYFQRVNNLKPKQWVRMTDNGRTLTNKVTGAILADVYNLVETGRHDGPESRASLRFNGSGSIEQREPDGSNQDENITYPRGNNGNVPHSFEFAFRTDRANEFILGGSDGFIDISTGVASSPNTFSELVLVDGKLGINQYTSYSQNGVSGIRSAEVARGFRSLADNEWHTVVVRNYQSTINSEIGFEVWIDGTLEYRRLVRGIITFAWPDYIGYRPQNVDGIFSFTGALPALADNEIFHGDFSEMVYYDYQLGKDDIERNRYAFMGWIPVEAEPMVATLNMPTAKTKGNQKKALYLYWKTTDEIFTTAGGLVQGRANSPENTNFDPNPAFQNSSYRSSLDPIVSEITGQWGGYQVTTKSVTVDYSGTKDPNKVAPYRDRVTDEQALIDLTYDVDLSEYDMIMFKDWPDETDEQAFIDAAYFKGGKDRLVQQLKDYRANGGGLYITNPKLALDLGIIDTYEWINTQVEGKNNKIQGDNAQGLYDYGSAVKFPWNIAGTDNLSNGSEFATGIGDAQDVTPAYLENKAYFYSDNNRINKFRLRAKIAGLTDIPSYMIQDGVFHVDASNQGWQGIAMKYLNRMDHGLDIGDEWIFGGASIVAWQFSDSVDNRYNRMFWTPATPDGAVNSGKIVTTFSETIWTGTAQVPNPYRNYATTIVLDNNDLLDGRGGGRVFVNFSEQPNRDAGLAKQVLPHTQYAIDTGNDDLIWPRGYGGGAVTSPEGHGETAAQIAWDYSWTRTTLVSTNSARSKTVLILANNDGTLKNPVLNVGKPNADDVLAMVRSSQLFPVEAVPYESMTGRGLAWIRSQPTTNAGDVTVYAEPMALTATAPASTVQTQKSTVYRASAMIMNAMSPESEQAKSGNVTYLATPMSVDLRFSQGGERTYKASPMEVNLTMPQIVLKTTGENIVLRLPRQKKIILRMEAR